VTAPLVVVGAGGHGREVVGLARVAGHHVVGVVDDSPSPENLARLDRLGIPLLGPVSTLLTAEAGTGYVLGVGFPAVRQRIAARLAGTPAEPVTIVHPDTTVGEDVELGPGCVLFPGVRVTTAVRLGRHVHLNQGSVVGHDTVLEDFAGVNPLAAVSGDCRIGAAALIGTTAAVLQGLTVGAGAIVGAGACVTKNVSAGVTVMGVPAR
jgi:sugar O-acyltransferase (sialic acid O-acetyltransferase NeuD family)